MAESYDLTKLDPTAFEHMVNLLVMRVLGAGHTSFGPGKDAGRDGYFEGEANYPSEAERWSGHWYIQSKFHKPHLSKDPQKWLLAQIQEELKEFANPSSQRKWPDNWIVATNIDPSGAPETGAFDRAKTLVSKANPRLENRFHIWGGRKILDLLQLHPEVSEYYKHFLTPGHVLTELFNQIKDAQAELQTILYHLIVTQFDEQQYTKLEQAGSKSDTRPGIHKLYIDLPFQAHGYTVNGLATANLMRAAARSHRYDSHQPERADWVHWHRHPTRARVWFIKGGPGQGKSTIGQYFCQVQRAALILQKDGLTVNRQLKNLATEVKRAAERIDLGPAVPRIPISLELKEYAQWFGKRDRHVARGVLTYLAERISSQVEQPVLVGTLKRALQTRSWFIVFDGLDEVPHDVKDAIAGEVRHFIDSVVFENNADVLTICTSRPQGYSGQFSDLDGPTIELVNLTPELALACAKPVLELNRSEEEARRYSQILQTAIQSPSVRELMTTPLQSHIMAVIVRGGGKPPERRWQLFTTFYDVIKDREANKDFPDPKIAKLLREDDQLLKTVHNRLGFILHARAETSEGAQTNLSRDEFKSLVSDAVDQMMEKEFEITVDVLMEATTERLVLVSTPDDGDHVRFDIRPLQEFFAAEFLYESVSAETLRRRMEVISGDSHWREVIHFLMSALIESNRQTELTVAIEVLKNLNEVGDHHRQRLLSRRLGRGSLVAARLLREGVLEQDKRVRQQFRDSLDPLAAFTSTEQLQPLIETKHSNSQSWLINFLIDKLIEADPSENVGAAITLSFILPDNHERVGEVKTFFLSSPSDFISHVIASRVVRSYDTSFKSSFPVHEWFISVLLALLLQPEWSTLTISGISSAVEILRKHRDKALELAGGMLSPEQYEIFDELISELESRGEQQSTKRGLLLIDYHTYDWQSTTSAYEAWPSESLHKVSSSPRGVLGLVSCVIAYAKTRSFSDFCRLINHPDRHLCDALPSRLQAYIPFDGSTEETVIAKLKCLNKSAYKLSLLNDKFRSFGLTKPVMSLSIGAESSLDQWRHLLNDHLDLIIMLWTELGINDTERKPEIFEDDEAIKLLIEGILQQPDLLRYNPLVWGELIKLCPEREQEIRSAILTCISKPTYDNWGFRALESEPLRLNLPFEAPLIPHIIHPLVASMRNIHRSLSEVDSLLSKLRRFIELMIDGTSQLKMITENQGLTSQIRAGAALMLMLHPKGENNLLPYIDTLGEAYNPNSEDLYLKSITSYLMYMTTENDLAAKQLTGILLDKARADYQGRQHLESLLSLWRERSQGPVLKANLHNEWLAGR